MSARSPFPNIAFALLAACFALYCLTNNVVDPDLWGHIRFGLDIIESGSIPRFDTYSYTAFRMPWINHEWAAELIFALLYRNFGGAGIIAIRLVVGASVLGIALRHLWKGITCGFEWRVLCACLVTSIASYGLCFRPQIFSYLFFTLLIAMLLERQRGRALLILAMFLVWVNCHGGFLMGLSALAIYGAVELADALRRGQLRRSWRCIALVAASSAAILVNPYGARLWTFLFSTVTLGRPYLFEWNPVQVLGVSFIDFKALFALFIIAIGVSRTVGNTWLFILTLFCAAASFIHNRHMPFFAIAAAFSLPAPLNAMMNRLGHPFREHLEGRRGVLGAASIALSGLIIAAIPFSRGKSAWSLMVEADRYPVAAVRWMKEEGIRGNCAVFFNWGEYAIWHLRGAVKVSIDGRYDTVYPESVIDDNFRFFFAGKGWETLLRAYPTDIVLIHPLNPIAAVMERMPGWSITFGSDTALVFLNDRSFPGFVGKKPVTGACPRKVPFP